jgi:hypothetical protein
MTDVTQGGASTELSAADEQLLRELTERAPGRSGQDSGLWEEERSTSAVRP